MKTNLQIAAVGIAVVLCALAIGALRPARKSAIIDHTPSTPKEETTLLLPLGAPDEAGSRASISLPAPPPQEHASPTLPLAQALASSFAPGGYPDPGRVTELLSVALSELSIASAVQPSDWTALGVGGLDQRSGSKPWKAGSEYSLELRFPLIDLDRWSNSISATLVLSVDGISDPRPPGFIRVWVETQPAEEADYGEKEAISAIMSLDLESGWLRYGDILYKCTNGSLSRSQRWRGPWAQQYFPDLSSIPIEAVEDLARAHVGQH